jgi:hypothetical protein
VRKVETPEARSPEVDLDRRSRERTRTVDLVLVESPEVPKLWTSTFQLSTGS